MNRRTGRVPAYRLHRPSGQARVIINGRHIYLGKFGSPESHLFEIRVDEEVGTQIVPLQIRTPQQACGSAVESLTTSATGF
jgi:hypothetical protein